MDKVLNILIVEDELIVAEAIKEMAEEIGHEVAHVAGTIKDAVSGVDLRQIDIALLDINLNDPDGNGFDVAKYLESQYQIPFIFITAYSDPKNLDAAKALNPQGYILKPINKDRLYVAITLAIDNAFHRKEKPSDTQSGELQGFFQDSFFVKDGQYTHKIVFDDILFLKSEGNYTEIVTSQKTYLIRSLLKQIIDRLPAYYFMRVHRSYIINVKKITSLNQYEVTINNTLQVPVGETYKKEVTDFFEKFN